MCHRTRTGFITAPLLLVILIAASAAAQTSAPPDKPRRHFISVSYDWSYTQPLHFAEHPLEDLVGTDVASAQREAYDYRTRDGNVLIDVLEFKRRGRGVGLTVYPLGSSVGATLALRGSVEDLPVIRVAFEGEGAPPGYALTGARAYDVGAGIHVADRSPGWGLGSQAFVIGGIGRIRSDLGDGSRYFAEGGGGLTSGPLGVELAVKFAWNRLDQPVDHRFITVPITLRGSLTF
jgi:hypothetical protein